MGRCVRTPPRTGGSARHVSDAAAEARMQQLCEEMQSQEVRVEREEVKHGRWSHEYRAALEIWNSAGEELGQYIAWVRGQYTHSL